MPDRNASFRAEAGGQFCSRTFRDFGRSGKIPAYASMPAASVPFGLNFRMSASLRNAVFQTP